MDVVAHCVDGCELCKRKRAHWAEAAQEAVSVQQCASLHLSVDVPWPASSPALTFQSRWTVS